MGCGMECEIDEDPAEWSPDLRLGGSLFFMMASMRRVNVAIGISWMLLSSGSCEIVGGDEETGWNAVDCVHVKRGMYPA